MVVQAACIESAAIRIHRQLGMHMEHGIDQYRRHGLYKLGAQHIGFGNHCSWVVVRDASSHV
jgi:hypothetical protein